MKLLILLILGLASVGMAESNPFKEGSHANYWWYEAQSCRDKLEVQNKHHDEIDALRQKLKFLERQLQKEVTSCIKFVELGGIAPIPPVIPEETKEPK